MAQNQVDTLDALAVAIHAYDVNTKVVKFQTSENLVPNATYIRDYFGISKERTTPDFLISPDLREQAETVRIWFEHNLTLSLLTRGMVSDFQNDMAELVKRDTINPQRFGLLIWAPKMYCDQQARDTVKETVMQMAYRSHWIGKEKQSVTVKFTLLEKRWHRDYNSWTAFGHDEHMNLVRFMTKHEHLCATGTIVGRVKAHGTERYHDNGKITTLNFVKAVCKIE
jgi:hypothetical protein